MKKTIVLVGVSAVGHHIAFMRLFVDTLLDLGYRVLVLFPEETPIKDWLMEHRPQDIQDVFYYPYKEPTFQVKNWGRFNEAFAMRKKWLDLARTIRKAEKQFSLKADFVYFSWIDTYTTNYLLPIFVDTVFRYPWSGLYFHPRHYRLQNLKDKVSPSDLDIVFKSRYCKNITIHDEGIIGKFEKRLGKKTILFPEIADDSPPNMDLPVIQEIKRLAKGRTILIIAGMLDNGKRQQDFLALSRMCNPEEFYFVMAGPINTKYNRPQDRLYIEEYLKAPPENIYIYNQYVQEGAEFNAFIAVSDIIFLIYDNFPSSSNRLTKGAIFKKYILTQNRFCTGEDVEKYGLGLTVEEGDLPAALDALNKLRHKILHEPFPTAQFETYRELHSVGKLKERFREVLETL
jgi:hypothetical protein